MTTFLLLFRTSFKLKLLSVLVLTVLADFLFYGHKIGWTIGLFGLLLTGICVTHNAHILKYRSGVIILALTVGQCLLQIEKNSALCFILMFVGIISLAILSQGGWRQNAYVWFKRVLSSIFRILRPVNKAFIGIQKYRHKFIPENHFLTLLRGWFLPVVLSGIFIVLFSSANPIVTKWFSGFDFTAIFESVSVWRILFLLGSATLIFSVVRPKIKPIRKKNSKDVSSKDPKIMSFSEWAFTKKSVLRSLVIFNLIFAFQTVMDMNYLWAGGDLPKGITYAEYAQKGAYPLIITALLAAVFVLVSQNAGHEVSESKTVRTLIYVWVVQNVMLVLSSIYRTGLYVEMYALTYWRVAAFIWMGLVAFGLCWIVVRSILEKSNIWLINMNIITLLAVLYITSFVNIGGMIAHYNVSHSKEMSGQGVYLDHYYLKSIGAQAIPALKRFERHNNHGNNYSKSMTNKLSRNMDDWRRWTYSEYRLLKSLESNKK